jgi:mono/diheme cytochrome c family protein
VRIAQVLFLVIAAAPLLPGCGRPESQFQYNQKTDQLVPEVAAAVKDRVDESFGTPAQSVAWLRMPVDFGALAGRVVPPPGERTRAQQAEDEATAGHRLRVEFPPQAEGEPAPDLDKVNLAGLALVWTSGRYADGAQIDKGRGPGQLLYSLQIGWWDHEEGIITLIPRMDPPPEPGDTFTIVGHKLSAGRQLYAAHCQHCHGVSGDGAGPTAQYLNPLPRDYRLGKFKFQSTPKTDRPTDEDLERVIRLGIPGTYMPSFLLLEDDELDVLVDYVKFLSMRGEYELKLVNQLFLENEQGIFEQTIEQEEGDAQRKREFRAEQLKAAISSIPDLSESESQVLAGAWTERTVVIPSIARVADTAESRARGRDLYLKNCAACHGATGRGDGEQVDQYMVNEITREKYLEPGLFDDWGQQIKPRDLTRGIYRGGRRPVDLYRRMYEGINGTPMPPFKGKFSPDPAEDSARVWDIVNYVYSLQFGGVDGPGTVSSAAAERTAAAR